MSIYELLNKWNNIGPDLKIDALQAVIDHLRVNVGDVELLDIELYNFFDKLTDFESEDFFGTEGLQI